MTRSRLPDIRIEADELNSAQPLGRYLVVLFRQFEDELAAELHARGHRDLLVTDFNILRFISPEGSSAQTLARLAGVTKQAISQQLAHLEKRGLCRREADPNDLRAKRIRFTAKGRRVIEDAIRVTEKIEARQAAVLGQTSFEKLKEQLGRLIEAGLK